MLKQKGTEASRTHIASLFVVAFVLGILVSGFSSSSAADNQKLATSCNGTSVTQTVESEADTTFPPKPVLPDIVYTGDGFPNDLTTVEQADLLIYAYNVAKSDGHRDPTVLQGLIWQESHAGGYEGHEVAGDEYGLRVGKRYYGIGQIKVAAAKDVFKRFPDEFSNFYEAPRKVLLANGKTKRIPGRYLMTDEEIIAHLIIDKKFNIRVASKYLWMMGRREKRGKPTYVRPTNFAITAYNRGVGNTFNTDYNNWHYTVSVNKYRTTWIPVFNEANKTRLDIDELVTPTTTADASGQMK